MSSKLRQIAVSYENYIALKGLGAAGDSFNDVITEVLRKLKEEGKKPLRTSPTVAHPAGRSQIVEPKSPMSWKGVSDSGL